MITSYPTRQQFGQLFQSVFQTGTGAEIGVQNGFNAKNIFESGWSGTLFCVDRWEKLEELRTAIESLKGKTVMFIKGESAASAEVLPDASLDWVYIDAGHSYAEVKADFEAWFPKVRTGGIISGHDYGENDCIGVKEFIDEYIVLHPEVEMHFTTEDFFEEREYQSWWFIKTV